MCLCIITGLHYIMCLSASIARTQTVPFVRATTKPFITHSSHAFHMCLTYNLPHWSCWVLASWQLHYLSGNGTAPHSRAIFYTVFWIHKQSLEADVLPLESWGCSPGLMFFLACTRLSFDPQHNIHIHMCLLGLWCQEFCWLLLTRFVGSSLTPHWSLHHSLRPLQTSASATSKASQVPWAREYDTLRVKTERKGSSHAVSFSPEVTMGERAV